MMVTLYTIGIMLYVSAIRLAALFHTKARQWVEGRKAYWQHHAVCEVTGHKWIWFHCASLGEFEQGRPIIEALKAGHPEIRILLSFYSPSGYMIRKDYPLADKVVYLPPDIPYQVRRFLQVFRPDLAIFVKYEFWHNYLIALHKHGIPYFFISSSFRPGQVFFKPWGQWFRKQLQHASRIFVQDIDSLHLLQGLGITNASLSGDTRYDRVMATAASFEEVSVVKDFAMGKHLMVAGSTWPADEDCLIAAWKAETNLHFIIAPHEVNEGRIQKLCARFGGEAIRYSSLLKVPEAVARVLIIDNIGLLSKLYAYGQIAYVGGGFGSGLHNILEPAAHGKPVIFGPKHKRFPEAKALIQAGGALEISGPTELVHVCAMLFSDQQKLAQMSLSSKTFTRDRQGATSLIMKTLTQYLQAK